MQDDGRTLSPASQRPKAARARLVPRAAAAVCFVILCLSAAAAYVAIRQGANKSPADDSGRTASAPTLVAPVNAAPPPEGQAPSKQARPASPLDALLAGPTGYVPQGLSAGSSPTGGSGRSVSVADASSKVAALKEKVRANPRDVNARVALLTCLDVTGKTSEAEDLIRDALQQGQRDPKLYHALGILYMRHKLYDGAAEVFRCEVEIAPRDADANLRLAECYSLVGNRERASTYFAKVIQLKPNEPDAYLGLANINSSSQRSPLAIKYLKKYIELSPTPGNGYLLLSRILVNQRRCDEAIDAGLKGVAAMPSNADMWYNLAQAYAYSPGNTLLPKAEEAFLRAIQLSPDNGHGHFELANVYTRMGRIPDAVQQFAEAVRCEPLRGRYRYQYGRALLQARRQPEATRELARAKELLPLNQREDHLKDRLATTAKDANAWIELAGIYKQYGQPDTALACVDRALEISPGMPVARTLRQELSAQGVAPAPSQ